MAVNRKFKSTLLENVSLTESVFLKVETKTAKFIIAVVYLPPDSSTTEYRRFLTALDDISSRLPQHKLLVGGDFNLHHVCWVNHPLQYQFSAYSPPDVRDKASMVCDTFSLLDAQQLFPLHLAKGYTLDLLFASPDCAVDLECLDPLLHSDNHHVPQYFRVSAPLHSQDDSSVPLRHNFFKCNYLAVNEHFNNIDWDNCLDSGDVSACVSKFNDVVSQAISSHVPLSSSSQCSFPKWYTPKLKSLINEKKCEHLM